MSVEPIELAVGQREYLVIIRIGIIAGPVNVCH